jgi:hypothetical protein
MDAAADYAAVKAMLTRPLPAYVSYTVRSHVKFDAILHDDTDEVTVRTSDGKIIKGRIPEGAPNAVHFSANNGSGEGTEPVKGAAFRASCYEAKGATMTSYLDKPVEAIALRETCSKNKDDKDFDTLYVDPRSHEPVAAVGTDSGDNVDVHLAQAFSRTGDHVLPSTLYVRVKGSGLMFWLDLLVDQRYENYRFSATPP